MTGAVGHIKTADAISSETKPKAGKQTLFNAPAHALRGIASLMVFFAHLLGGTAEHIYAADTVYVQLIQAPWNFGRWGVELFFVISGFVILPSVMRYAPKDFAVRRFFRLYPLFAVLTFIFIALNWATNEYPEMNTWTAIISGILFLNLFTGTEQLTPNAWSLTYEVIFYVLACLLFHFSFRTRQWLWSAVMAVAAIAFVVTFPIAIYFLFGVIIRLMYDRELFVLPKYARPLELLCLGICILCASAQHFGYKHEDLANPLVPLTMVFTACYFYFAIIPNSLTGRILGNRFFSYLGTVSYSLYLVHPYTYFAVRGLFVKFELFSDDWLSSMALFFLVTTPITLAITHAVHKCVELWPYEWFFKQRIYRKPETQEQLA